METGLFTKVGYLKKDCGHSINKKYLKYSKKDGKQ